MKDGMGLWSDNKSMLVLDRSTLAQLIYDGVADYKCDIVRIYHKYRAVLEGNKLVTLLVVEYRDQYFMSTYGTKFEDGSLTEPEYVFLPAEQEEILVTRWNLKGGKNPYYV